MRRIIKTYAGDYDSIERTHDLSQIRISSTDMDVSVETYHQYAKEFPHYLITRDGKIYAFVPEHRSCAIVPNIVTPSQRCYEVMLMNGGPRMKYNGNFYPIVIDQHHMPTPNIMAEPDPHPYEYCTVNKYRCFAWYQNYTTAQLEALKELLLNICKRHNIPTSYCNRHGDLRKEAVNCPGIFLGSAFSRHVTGAHPSTELLNILKSIAL